MDRKIPQTDIKVGKEVAFWRKYKYYMVIGAVLIILAVMVIRAVVAPSRLRYDKDNIMIVEVSHESFQEYLEVDGVAEPILTVKLTADESGIVEKVIALESSLLAQGDTILVLKNHDLTRAIDEELDELEKARVSYEESMLQIERRRSEMKMISLSTIFELDRLSKKYELDKEEYAMGILSKAQLEIASDEHEFNVEKTKLKLEELRADSLANIIQADLKLSELKREEKKFERNRERLDKLILRAPVTGQIGYLDVLQGDRVSIGTSIGEMKIINDMKISVNVAEYYHGRIVSGMHAFMVYEGRRIPLRVSRVYPELRERNFAVDLVFYEERPDNLLLGKTYRIHMELGQAVDANIIPKGNFYRNTGGQWIFKLDKKGQRAHRTYISIGKQNPKQYEILDGLSPGDKVIVTGYDNFGDVQELILK